MISLVAESDDTKGNFLGNRASRFVVFIAPDVAKEYQNSEPLYLTFNHSIVAVFLLFFFE